MIVKIKTAYFVENNEWLNSFHNNSNLLFQIKLLKIEFQPVVITNSQDKL